MKSPNFTYINAMKKIKQDVKQLGYSDPIFLGTGANSTISIQTNWLGIHGTKGQTWHTNKYNPNFLITQIELDENGSYSQSLKEFYDIKEISSYDVLNNYSTDSPIWLYELIYKE